MLAVVTAMCVTFGLSWKFAYSLLNCFSFWAWCSISMSIEAGNESVCVNTGDKMILLEFLTSPSMSPLELVPFYEYKDRPWSLFRYVDPNFLPAGSSQHGAVPPSFRPGSRVSDTFHYWLPPFPPWADFHIWWGGGPGRTAEKDFLFWLNERRAFLTLSYSFLLRSCGYECPKKPTWTFQVTCRVSWKTPSVSGETRPGGCSPSPQGYRGDMWILGIWLPVTPSASLKLSSHQHKAYRYHLPVTTWCQHKIWILHKYSKAPHFFQKPRLYLKKTFLSTVTLTDCWLNLRDFMNNY